MEITYLGHSAVLLTASSGETLLFDPFTKIGYEMCPISPTVCVYSHNHYDHNFIDACPLAKIGFGEDFNQGAFSVNSFFSYHDEKEGKLRGENFIYCVKVDGVTVCHMGDFGENVDKFDFSILPKIDLLFLPVGGTYTIDAKSAKKVVDKINPKFIIPIHFKTEKSRIDIAPVADFLSYFEKFDELNTSSVSYDKLRAKVTVLKIKEK